MKRFLEEKIKLKSKLKLPHKINGDSYKSYENKTNTDHGQHPMIQFIVI